MNVGRTHATDGFPIRTVLVLCLALAVFTRPLGAQEGPIPLEVVLESALSIDPAVAASRAHLQSSEAEADRLRGVRLPQASLDASLTRFQEPMVVAPLHSFDPSSPPMFDQTLLQGAARVRYTAFDGGAAGARVESGRASREAADAALSDAQAALLERAVHAYLLVLSARGQDEAAGRWRLALEEERDRALRNVDAGTAPEVEVLRAEAALAEASADAAAARVGRELAERDLARLVGLAPEEVIGRVLQDITLAPVATDVSGAATVAASHPEILRVEASERAAHARVKQERGARFPRLELSAAALDYGTATGNHVVEWQAGFMVSWPLFTGGSRGAAIRKAEADLARTMHERRSLQHSLDARIDGARALIVEADTRASSLAAALTQWEEVARIERLALETGAGVQSDLITAEARLFRARSGWRQAYYDRVLARVRLARAMGVLDEDWLRLTLEVGS